MSTVSLSIVISDADTATAPCLYHAAAFADEIIVVNARDTDHLADAWNVCFSKSTQDYIFWLNPTDMIDNENWRRLIKLKNELNDAVDVVVMSGKPRLVKRENHYVWFDPACPHLYVWGKKYYADIVIDASKKSCTAYETVRLYEKAFENGESMSPRSAYYYAQALKRTGRTAEALQYAQLFLETCV